MPTTAAHLSCPTDVVNAPVEVVWVLVTDFARWGDFYDISVERVTPPGRAVVGQRMEGRTGPGPLKLRIVFEVTGIDETRHRLGLVGHMPFGVTVHEDMIMLPIDATHCRVNYNCNFTLPDGLRGRLLWAALRREFDRGPADSLARLKRKAEQEFGRDYALTSEPCRAV